MTINLDRLDGTPFKTPLSLPPVTITTQYGPVKVVFLGENTASVRTDAAINDDRPALTYRDVDYLAHVYLQREGGAWVATDASSIYRRADHRNASPSVLARLTTLIAAVVTDYVERDPAAPLLAQYAATHNALGGARGDAERLSNELDAAREREAVASVALDVLAVRLGPLGL